MKTYNYTKITIILFALAALVDWFFYGTFGFICIALAVIPAIFAVERRIYKNSNSKPE